jgi:hypothetical protein
MPNAGSIHVHLMIELIANPFLLLTCTDDAPQSKQLDQQLDSLDYWPNFN